MAVCANCSRALQPEWKFCIYCGTRTGVAHTATTPIPTAARAPTRRAPVARDEPAPVLRAEDIPADEPEPTPTAIRPEATRCRGSTSWRCSR